MTFKIDENLPAELVSELRQAGHDAETVFGEGMAGSSDNDVVRIANREGRILLTLDKGIADVRHYPPQAFPGIVLFRPEARGRGEVFRFVRRHLGEILKLDIKGRLLVVTPRGIRVR